MNAIIVALLLGAGDGGAACYANLCGMDSYCSCHGEAGARRCWSTAEDCEVDRACCAAGGDCRGMVRDECHDATVKERKRRDEKKKGSP